MFRLLLTALVLSGLAGCASPPPPTELTAEPIEAAQIQADIRSFVSSSYPDMEVTVRPWEKDSRRLAIYFVESKFALLYPQQRFHYLSHLIPADYQEKHLVDSVWFELAPGETPDDLVYPDEELTESIAPDVLKVVSAANVFEDLDDSLCPDDECASGSQCFGDYRHTRAILLQRGFKESELFDVLHVFMAKGGHCDCEILYNVAEQSRLASEYWTARSENRRPHDPHTPATD